MITGGELSTDATDAIDLRHFLRDLVALSALPAVWVGQSPELIVEGCADALLRTLRVEFVYARVEPISDGGSVLETVISDRRNRRRPSASYVGHQLSPWLKAGDVSVARQVPSPLTPGCEIALAVAPVGHTGGALGLVAAGSGRRDFASPYDRLLMRVGANQLAVALQGAQLQAAQAELEHERRVAELLEKRVAERTRELESLYRADESLYASLRLDDVLRGLAEVASDVVASQKSIVFVPDPDSGRLIVRVARGFSASTMSRLSLGPDEGVVAHVMRTKSPVSVANIHTDPRASAQAASLLEPEEVCGLLSVPIMLRDEVVAVLNVYRPDPIDFNEAQKRVVVALAQRAGMAIENARLYEAARTVAALDERQRLARELHDSISQALYGIGLGAQTALDLLARDQHGVVEPLQYIQRLTDAALAEMRALIFALRPESLEKEGLVAALHKQASALQARYDLKIVEHLSHEPEIALPEKEVLLRIAQEAMHNVAKHARATSIEVTLDGTPTRVVLSVRDNGVGFDASQEFPGHLGLQSMRERAREVGGDVELSSAPGRGTRITVSLPTDTSAD